MTSNPPEQTSRLVMINGVPCKPEDAKISVFDRSYLYGEGVFETLRTYQGKPWAVERHVERWMTSAEKLCISADFTKELVVEEVACGLGMVANQESVVRMILSQCSEPPTLLGMDPKITNRVFLIEPLNTGHIKNHQLKVGTIPLGVGMGSLMGLKTTSYLSSVIAMRYARENQLDEVLLFDHEQRILEGSTSNVVVLSEEQGGIKARTPPDSLGILSGITRVYVERCCGRLGVEFSYEPIFRDSLKHAEEVLLCSSLRGVASVSSVDGIPIRGGEKPLFTTKIAAEFQTMIEEELGLKTDSR